jgi:hypothetical protein
MDDNKIDNLIQDRDNFLHEGLMTYECKLVLLHSDQYDDKLNFSSYSDQPVSLDFTIERILEESNLQ